jgi:two-component system NtrC family sensor kinase
MKYAFLSFLLLSCSQIFGQQVPALRPFSENGSTLSKHWKWHAGDNPQWAQPTFDDQKWSDIQLDQSIHHLPQIRQAQLGWLRRPIRVNALLVNKPLCFYIRQVGAAEIYLDGKPLDTLGVVSSSPSQEVTHSIAKVIPFSLSDTNQHTIAVRFSFTKNNFYYPGSNQETFTLKVFETKTLGSWIRKTSSRTSGFLFFSISLFLVFSILHFLFYRSNRSKTVSLTLGFTMLTFALAFVAESLDTQLQSSSHQQIGELTTFITFYLGVILINVSLYHYLHQPFSYFFFIQAILIAVSLVCMIMEVDVPYGLAVWPPFLLIFTDFIRVSILAERRKDSNAKVPIYSLVVAAGCLVLAIVFFSIAGAFVGFNNTQNGYLEFVVVVAMLLIFVMLFSIPVGLSFSLVREYSRTHQSLRKKIQELESLSAKSLAQEQEKQHILAVQNETLERQVAERTNELKASIEHLKTTQDQLIQSEKLASLGELTAGIAHEIQNPLNFVNNFSEVSIELLKELNELKEEKMAKGEGPKDDELETELLGDIEQNLQKINHHGKRASSIVKGMLEHSRTGSGKKEPIDINTLADEYLRLAYHGLRAKDKCFNADFNLEAAENLPKINVVAQDISRVLLNLINNAFYAVQQKKAANLSKNYQPAVWVSTQHITDKNAVGWVEIHVKDNGTGIPEEVQDKIFQPFFTTKPTGQGTGLGLSLAYDIVTKGHGGTLDVESRQGEGTEFIVKLPV